MSSEVLDLLKKIDAHLRTANECMTEATEEISGGVDNTDKLWKLHGTAHYFLSLARMRTQDAININNRGQNYDT